MRISTTPRGPLIRLIKASAFLLCMFAAHSSYAQSRGDFRSRTSGDWKNSNTWEEYTNSWTNTNDTPDDKSGLVTIRTGHTVNGNVRDAYDEIVVEAGAHLEISQVFQILDGPGTDLEVFGTLSVHKTTRLTQTATAIFRPGSVTNIDSNDRFRFEGNSTATFQSGSIVSMSGIFQPEDDAIVYLNNGSYFTNNGQILLRNRSQLFVNNSTIDNQGAFDVTQNSIATFMDGGEYIHNQNGGKFPTASNTIWSAGSEARVTGITNSLPSELDVSFHHFTWNNPSQSADFDLGGEILGILGNLSIHSTNSGVLTWNETGSDLTIGGNFEQTGGSFRFTDTGSNAWVVNGNFNQTAGTSYLTSTSGSPSLSVKGDFNVATGLVKTGPLFSQITLDGSASQLVSANGTLTGNMHLLLSGSSLKILGENLVVPGNLTETSGGLNVAGNNMSLSGNLLISNQFTNASQIVFNGLGPMSIQLPSSHKTVSDIVLDGSGSSLTLNSDLNISTILAIRSGNLDVNGNSLVLSSGAVLYNGGSVSGNVTMSRYFGLNSDGWRMVASPLSSVSLSSLNAAFWTQGGSWASNPSGASNLHSFNFSTQDWTGYTGANTTFNAASAYILYGYKLDNVGASILPTTWTTTGSIQNTTNSSLQYSGTASSSYNFVGNPLSTNIDWNTTYAASSGIASSYATWDPSLTTGGGTTGYKYYNASTGIGQAGRYIPPFTGFMVGATASSPNLEYRTSEAASRSSANYYGKGNEVASHIQLLLEGNGLAEDETYLSFSAEAHHGFDETDVERLNPLSLDFATIWMPSTDKKLAFDGRSMESGREIYDLVFATTKPGTYELSASALFEIPESWTISVIDLETGQSKRIDNGEVIHFSSRSQDVVTLKNPLSTITTPRFRIVVEDPAVATEEPIEEFSSTNDVVLSQNYPNPFNPTTSIRFSIPESAPVSLEVYDALGRRIHTLVNETKGAGWHEVSWSANDLSSGMYFYRLSIGSQVLTRSMLLLR